MQPLAIGNHLHVADQAGNSVQGAQVVALYRRGDELHATAAPTIRNAAIAMMNGTGAEVIAILCTRGGVPLIVGRRGCLWFDCDGDPLRVKFDGEKSC